MTHQITKFLDELSELEKNATKGPWRRDSLEGGSGCKFVVADPNLLVADCSLRFNTEFIATSRNTLPKLIEAMRVLVRVCEDVKINFDDTQFPENYCYIDFREKAKQALEKVEGILK